MLLRHVHARAIPYDDSLTETALLDILRRKGQNGEYFNHYLHSHIRHCGSRWDLRIDMETLEEIPDTFEEIDEGVVARADLASCLI